MTVRFDAVAPFDGDGILDFLACRCVPGIDAVEGRTYRRPGVSVTVDDGGAEVTADADVGDRVRHLLDLDADPDAVAAVLGADPVLAPLVGAAPGLRVPGAWDPFEVVVRAIVGQQVTVAAARTLLARVVDRCGGMVTPEALLAADLGAIGMPASRAATLVAAAAAVADGDVVLDGSVPSGDVIAQLLAVRGIGPWTAQYVALRALGDRDAFPVGDAGLRIAAGRLGLPSDPSGLAARAERWRPYRASATLHLWRTLA